MCLSSHLRSTMFLTMINQHQCLKPPPIHTHTHTHTHRRTDTQQISTPLPSTTSSSDQQQPWSEMLYGGGWGAAAWLGDTWQVLQLWSAFCKESLAAENAAVSRRFTAQSLQSFSLPGFFPRAGGDSDVSPSTPSALTLSITSLFISFFNELIVTSADSVSGVWASSSLSPGWPPPKWQTCV